MMANHLFTSTYVIKSRPFTIERLEEVCERFKRWRERRGRGEHIPRELWAAFWVVLRVDSPA